MIKVYHLPRSRSLRVVWLMEELEEPYEVERLSFPFPAEFLAKNPEGSVPFIEDDEIGMAESIAILQYITGRRLTSRPGLPALTVGPRPDPAAYAEHLQFLHLGEASLAAPLTAIVYARVIERGGEAESITRKIGAGLFARRLPVVEKRLADGRTYLTGEQLTIADISVGYALHCAEGLEIDMPGPVRAYYERLKARPAYQRALAK